jgi:hypothetical protein
MSLLLIQQQKNIKTTFAEILKFAHIGKHVLLIQKSSSSAVWQDVTINSVSGSSTYLSGSEPEQTDHYVLSICSSSDIHRKHRQLTILFLGLKNADSLQNHDIVETGAFFPARIIHFLPPSCHPFLHKEDSRNY